MSSLPREVSDKDILKGKLYYVALPFTAGRPLSFVEEAEGQQGFFRVITKDDGLEGLVDPTTGKKKAAELKVVTNIKMRPCVVIQPDEYNQNERYPFVIVLPVETMKQSHKTKGLYKRMMKKNDLPMLYYLGRDNYITINDPYKVYKNVLFSIDTKLNYNVSDIDIEEIMKRFAQCFEIKKIRECEECEKNCAKCEYKLAVNK